VRWRVEWGGVHDSNTVPARLHLYGKVALETFLRVWLVEDGLEWRVFEGRAVDVACDPIIIENGRALACFVQRDIQNAERNMTYEVVMEHVVCRTRDARIIPPALPDQLQQVVYAR
jgi:hypothetical protein